MPRRFLADRMLGRLSRWLRLAGEDVLQPARSGSRAPSAADLLGQARAEGRIVLTRDRAFPGFRHERLVLVATDLEAQLREFYRSFPADPLARAFARCAACNGELASVEREAVAAALPPAVRARGSGFQRCVSCGHVYWEGSHSERIRARLRGLREALDAPPGAALSSPVLAPDDHRGWTRFEEALRELVARLGLAWSGYRRPRRSLRGPLAARLAELGLRSFAEYLDHLETHREREEARLAPILAVASSRFFRDREDWAHLARVAFPALGARGRTVRAASLGCASGEEPFTLRLAWDQVAPLDILAVDVRADLLARAAAAVYPASSVHSVPPALLARHFARESGGAGGSAGAGAGAGAGELFRLDRAVVESVRFAHLDVCREPLPPGPFDLILCRNLVFTYLGEARRRELGARLAAALAPGGFLMIGGRERLPAGAGPERGLERGLERAGRCLYRLPPMVDS